MTHPSDLVELRERIRACSGPDREIDADIDIALFGGETIWKTANYTMEAYPVSRRPSKAHFGGFANEHVPLVTASIDAALSLCERVLKVHAVAVEVFPNSDHPSGHKAVAQVFLLKGGGTDRIAHKTAPLAVLDAALTAQLTGE